MENVTADIANSESTNIIEGNDQNFKQDVIDVSMTTPVIVDFWAPWCGPCKQLVPALEAAVGKANGAVKLVKINVDENPMIAGQLQVRSIPTVYAFFEGRPIDGFMGAKSPSEVEEFVTKLADMSGGASDDPLEAAIAQGQELFDGDDIDAAASVFAQVLSQDPSKVSAVAGLANCYLKKGALDHARELMDQIPEDMKQDAAFEKILNTLALADEASGAVGEMDELRRKIAESPSNLEAKFDLSSACFATGEVEEAMALLLEIFAQDREWNEGAARPKLLELFEAIGHADPRVIKARKKLSSLMFSV